MKKWKVWLLIVAVFVSGTVIGSVGTQFYYRHTIRGILHRGPAAVREVIMKKLTAELNLTKDQQEEVQEVLEETQFQLQQLRAEYHPKMEAIINNAVATMKTILSAEKQKKLDALYEQVKARWKLRQHMRENAK